MVLRFLGAVLSGILCGITVITLLATLAVFIFTTTKISTQPRNITIDAKALKSPCITIQCNHTTTILSDSMNTNTDPCDNFYRHACGNWCHCNPRPRHRNRWGTFEKNHEDTMAILEQLLQLHKHSERATITSAMSKAGQLYHVCNASESYRDTGNESLQSNEEIMEQLQRFGKFSLMGKSWLLEENSESLAVWLSQTLAAMRHLAPSNCHGLFGALPLLEIDVVSGAGKPVILITEPRPKFPAWIFNSSSDDVAYSMLRLILAISGYNSSDSLSEDILDEAKAIIKFENDLTQWIAANRKTSSTSFMGTVISDSLLVSSINPRWPEPETLYRTTVKSFLEVWGSNLAIDYKVLLQRTFNSFLLSGEEHLMVNVDYLKWLQGYLLKKKRSEIVNYVLFHYALDVIPHMHDCRLRKLYDKLVQVINSVPESQPTSQKCSLMVSIGMQYSAARLFALALFDSNKVLAEVYNIYHLLQDVLYVRIWTAQFLQSWRLDHFVLRRKAQQKIKRINLRVGWPSWILDISSVDHYYKELNVGSDHFQNMMQLKQFLARKELLRLREPSDVEEWDVSPLMVDVYLNPITHTLIIPAPLLLPPFYFQDSLLAINYGATGFIIAHELIHSLDNLEGIFSRTASIWMGKLKIPELVYTAYRKAVDCFASQYKKQFCVDDEGNNERYISGHELSSDQESCNVCVDASQEAVADNGGLGLALSAYQWWLKESSPKEESFFNFEFRAA